MISSNQDVRKSHNKILYAAYREFYYAGQLDIVGGFICSIGDEALHVNDIKFMIERLEVDQWVVKDEFDNIIIMNAYRLPQDLTIHEYPCQVQFYGHLDGGRTTFTHNVIYKD